MAAEESGAHEEAVDGAETEDDAPAPEVTAEETTGSETAASDPEPEAAPESEADPESPEAQASEPASEDTEAPSEPASAAESGAVLFLDPDEDASEDEVVILDEPDSSADDSVDSEDSSDSGDVLILDEDEDEVDEQGVRITELEVRVSALEAELEAAQAEAKAAKNRLLRTAADYENFRRRTTKEKEDLEKFSAQRVVREFLPVMDNLERAMAHVGDEETEEPASGLRAGVDMVMKQFRQSLQKQGVVGFDSLGEMFDPQVHEAIQQVDSDEHPTGTIVNEFQRGYHIHDKLLRPALVVVARNTSEEQA